MTLTPEDEEIAVALCRAAGTDPYRLTYHTIEPGVMEPYGDAWMHYLPLVEVAKAHCGHDKGFRAGLEAAADMAERLIKNAYNAGFSEGMKEHTSSRGGIPWSDSLEKKRGASEIRALLPAAPEREKDYTKMPGYPFLPCPICKGVEGCSDTVPERARAFINLKLEQRDMIREQKVIEAFVNCRTILVTGENLWNVSLLNQAVKEACDVLETKRASAPEQSQVITYEEALRRKIERRVAPALLGTMMRISKLISWAQNIQKQFGDTCVYAVDLSWGAVALNREAEDKARFSPDGKSWTDKPDFEGAPEQSEIAGEVENG